MIKLIASDMDGTFLDEHSQVPEGSFELIRELADAGVRFCVSSGRWPGFIQELFEPIKDEIDMICCNGGVIYSQGECLSWTPYDPDDLDRLVDAVEPFEGVCVVANDGKDNFILTRSQEKAQRALERYREKGIWLPEIGGVRDREYMAVGCPTETPEDALVYAHALTLELGDVFNFLPLGVAYFDASPKKTNKAVALRRLMEHYGIGPDEVMCYGDSLNDYTMMRAAGNSRATANAFHVIRDIADGVLPPNTEQGVQKDMARILEEARNSR